MKRFVPFLAAIAGVIFLLAFVTGKHAAQPASAAPQPVKILQQVSKPIEGWTICQDLGVGPVPGVGQPRQRFKLCHPDGWQVTTYCLRPDLPAPALGATCTRVNENTYNCGNGIQPVREYQVNQTPTVIPSPTDTPTATITPTVTQTTTFQPTATNTLVPYPTPTPTRRAPPGGIGFAQWLRRAAIQWIQPAQPTAFQPVIPSPTPFRPIHPTASFQEPVRLSDSPSQSEFEPITQSFYGIDLWNNQQPVRIRIYPTSNKINHGQPIDIEFIPAPDCQFGDGKACASAFRTLSGGETNFLTIHSGIGGEAQVFRHALEGTGIDRAALSLKQVEKNLQLFLGAEVLITQGDDKFMDLEVAALVRLPASELKAYIDTPVDQALAYAARFDPSILAFINSAEPLLILETCGWKMSGERLAPGTTDTSASIYVVVIRAR